MYLTLTHARSTGTAEGVTVVLHAYLTHTHAHSTHTVETSLRHCTHTSLTHTHSTHTVGGVTEGHVARSAVVRLLPTGGR